MRNILVPIVCLSAMFLASTVNAESDECKSAKRIQSFYAGNKKSTYEEKKKAKDDVKAACGTSSESNDDQNSRSSSESVQQGASSAPTIFVNCDQSGCWGTDGTRYTNIGNGNYVNSRTGKVVRPE